MFLLVQAGWEVRRRVTHTPLLAWQQPGHKKNIKGVLTLHPPSWHPVNAAAQWSQPAVLAGPGLSCRRPAALRTRSHRAPGRH